MRDTAARIVEGLSGGQEGIDKLAPAARSLLPALLRLAPAESDASGPALTALVNLSQVHMSCQDIPQRGSQLSPYWSTVGHMPLNQVCTDVCGGIVTGHAIQR